MSARGEMIYIAYLKRALRLATIAYMTESGNPHPTDASVDTQVADFIKEAHQKPTAQGKLKDDVRLQDVYGQHP